MLNRSTRSDLFNTFELFRRRDVIYVSAAGIQKPSEAIDGERSYY